MLRPEPPIPPAEAPHPNTGANEPASFQTFDVLDAVRHGNRDALGKIVDQYSPELERYLRHRLGRRTRREDDTQGAAQEVWLRACRNIQHFEYRGKGSFWRYLKTIAKNLTLKRKGRLPTLDVDEIDDVSERDATPIRSAIAGEEVARVSAAIQRLEPRERAALLLRLEDETYVVIARKCGYSSLDAARVAVGRAKEKIQRALGVDSSGGGD